MKEQFDTATWIDHLWFRPDGFTSGCAESFSFHGLTAGHESCAAPFWREFGTRYFWNGAQEYSGFPDPGLAPLQGDTTPFKPIPGMRQLLRERRFGALARVAASRIARRLLGRAQRLRETAAALATCVKERTLPPKRVLPPAVCDMLRIDSFFPNPVYWRHPAIPDDFISWGTHRSYFFKQGDCDRLARELDQLVDAWGICLLHSYPVYVGDANCAWETDAQGRIVVGAEFDAMLARMSALRRENVVNLALVRDVMHYWLQLERVRLEYRPEQGVIRVVNFNEETVRGLSLACHGRRLFVNGEEPCSKRVGDDWIFWFDLPARTYTTLGPSRRSSLGQGPLDAADSLGEPAFPLSFGSGR
jgi:hypothetical protein